MNNKTRDQENCLQLLCRGTDDVVKLDISSVQILTFPNKTKFPNSFYISIEMLIMSNYIYDFKFLCSEKHRVTRIVRFFAPLIISKAAFVTRSLLEKLGLYVLSFNSFTNTLILCQRGKPIYIFIVRNEQTYKQHHDHEPRGRCTILDELCFFRSIFRTTTEEVKVFYLIYSQPT